MVFDGFGPFTDDLCSPLSSGDIRHTENNNKSHPPPSSALFLHVWPPQAPNDKHGRSWSIATGLEVGPLDGGRNESTVQSNRNGLLFTMDGIQEVQEKLLRFVRSATMTRCGGECLSSCNVIGFRGFLALSSPSIRPFASSFASSATRDSFSSYAISEKFSIFQGGWCDTKIAVSPKERQVVEGRIQGKGSVYNNSFPIDQGMKGMS